MCSRHMAGFTPHLVPLILSPFGKPLLAPPFDSFHFNLSHSQGLALIAVSPSGAVGIDTEPLNRAPSLIGCESTFCHPEEIAALPTRKVARGEDLLRIWTAKEAYVKALGTGLSTRLETIRIHTLPKGIFAASTDGGAPIMRLHHPAMGCFLTHLCSLQPVYAVNIMGVRETPTKAAGIG